MSADIQIEHCTLRITRCGGWSWGADTRALLQAALQRMPAMLGARLAASWPDQHDLEVVAPLRLRLSVRMDDLLALAAGEEQAGAGVSSLASRLDAMLFDLVAREGASAPCAPSAALELPAAAQAPPDVNTLWAGTVLTVLMAWHRQGTLHEQLLMFSEPALESWHTSLSTVSRSCQVVGTALEAMAGQHAALALPLPAGRRASLVRRIGLMVAASSELGLPAGGDILEQVLAAHRCFDLIPAPADGVSAATKAPARRADAASETRYPGGHSGQWAPNVTRSPLARFDVKVASALPFLLLGPLSRTGYLQTLSAVFEAGQMLPALPAFAMALARKVLEPPQRGWFRGAQAVTAAAAFAGQAEPLPDAQIADMARLLAPLLSPLDSLVNSVLTAGHSPGDPLLLQAGWTLYEHEGMFPIACAERVEQLFARMAALGGELLLVPESALQPGLLTTLDNAGFRFITDARPARGEPWQSVFAGPLRAWTNDRSSAPPVLASAIGKLVEAGAVSAHVWQALTTVRPVLAGASVPALERSLALAAALALGTIGWSLWREREQVTPLLALDRFADLDARISFRPDVVQVHLPLGRRFMDLKRVGWLDDIADVPWLDGRPLRFVQG